ncbi:MAG: hypothetical protein WCS18_11590, partial [Sphaerochaetaceae bacterium]
YAFDIMVAKSIKKLDASGMKAKKASENAKYPADYRQRAKEAADWHFQKAREILRQPRDK